MTTDRRLVPPVENEHVPDGTNRTPSTGRQLVSLTPVTDEGGAQKTPQQIYGELMAQLVRPERTESDE